MGLHNNDGQRVLTPVIFFLELRKNMQNIKRRIKNKKVAHLH